MKNLLIALAIFILTSCSDPRAKDKEMLVKMEMLYGDMTKFEAECFIDIVSDNIDDDDFWDWFVGKATSDSFDTTSNSLLGPTRYEVELGVLFMGVYPQTRDECGFDLLEVVNSRGL